MAHFDRFDICAAWNLYLQHHWAGQGDRLYARWCKLRESFTPSRSEEFVHGLSENALEIYTQLCADAGTLERAEHPIANPGEAYTCADTQYSLFRMWAGSGFEPLCVYVWADSFEGAFEELVRWLDKTGSHIRSDEWGGDEVETGSDEYDRVLLASTEAAQSHFLAQDRAQAIAECEEVFKTYTHKSEPYTHVLVGTFQIEQVSNEGYNRVCDMRRHYALVNLFCKGITGDES